MRSSYEVRVMKGVRTRRFSHPHREFLFLLSHEMFDPVHSLFEYSSHDNHKLQIDPDSSGKPGHLNYFKFIGRVLGLCMFNPVHSLVEYSSHDNHKLQIDPDSGGKPGHLNYFKFIGRVLGLCIFHQCLLDTSFIVPFHKMILKKKVTLPDLESVDAELHHRMIEML